jgi:hypothetical protein
MQFRNALLGVLSSQGDHRLLLQAVLVALTPGFTSNNCRPSRIVTLLILKQSFDEDTFLTGH